jgi:glucan endo-1,3-alpha-glucosidase
VSTLRFWYIHILTLDRISDALALNMGGDDWEAAQVASAYAAAESLGTDFKLFISFDFTAMGCDLSDLVSSVSTYANHPNQFTVNGKPMISSYSGECLGNSGWQSLKDQTNGYTMPFIPGLEGDFNQWPALDSWYWLVPLEEFFCINLIQYVSWGCAWPQGDFNISVSKSWLLSLSGSISLAVFRPPMMNTVRQFILYSVSCTMVNLI